ncbi:Valyl-tRNA synthetase [Candidatus Phytoplasma phoenicium]|uniref:Valine--tRNA ligase n=2 Tax=Candidatus Phytoplasma phoenicium TaxID=198422 RepID=A0A0L0MKM4_9MOLU|nr:Valyl-tRNA synthetase [Candidatus Phytoplasma phoenicium]
MHSKYDFKLIEKNRYQKWLQKNYFQTENNSQKEAFTIVIPPPNITGKLHLGHAWNNTLQDIIIRRKKMMGFDVLFLPGMDHAGIATQSKIKNQLTKEGYIDSKKITKEIFLNHAWEWKEKYAKNIRSQWASLGLALDYNYEKFTLEPDLNQVIEKVFIQLFEEQLIYRDYKIIHWDPVLQTTLSNTEVKYELVQGQMFYLKYLLVQEQDVKDNDFVVVATTRPETIFVDQALMVHPQDKRYQHLIGKKVLIPDTDIVISIIGDVSVDQQFGTGILKVTPAHDENDFKVGKKHNLKAVSCINPDGTMNELAKEYKNLNLLICRKKIIFTLQQKNLLLKIEKHLHNVGFSIISGARVEPRLSLQWFFKTKALASFILKQHKLRFFPKRFLKIFNNWLQNVEDWCISRQIWWGHSIPAWYKGDEIKVQSTCPGPGFHQDSDVLDTWFSSSLWPLSTLGWPNINTTFFQKRFPINVLVTGYDILTFWVSKMVLQSTHLTQQIPFHDVLLHGLVTDTQGQKMSKSKGNGIDPQEVIEQYGADSLRWFLTTNVASGANLSFHQHKIIESYNFINKLWNISRLIILNVKTKETNFQLEFLSLPEKSLLTQFFQLMEQINPLYENYEFNIIGKVLYNFVWEDFANWFLEFVKSFLKKDDPEFLNLHKFVLYMFQNILKLLHPFIPFVTDAIYETLVPNQSILHTEWPVVSYYDVQSLTTWTNVKNLIIQMRRFRQNYLMNSQQLLPLYIEASEDKKLSIMNLQELLKNFLKASELYFKKTVSNMQYVLLFAENHISLFLDKKIFDNIDYHKRQQNFTQQKTKLLFEIKRSKKILSNKLFLQKASASKIREEQDKYQKYCHQYDKLMKG